VRQVSIEVYSAAMAASGAGAGALRRSGLAVREINIWTDRAAGRRGAGANGGDETVPLWSSTG